ncbi:MAG: ribonuclease E/G [Parvularculaceae bacterium]
MKRLIIECGAAQTRAAFLEGGRTARLWFGPARGDEMLDAEPRARRRFAGRVISVDHALEAAFIDIGAGRPGFMHLKKGAPSLAEGALVAIEVKSPPRQGKGALLKPLSDGACNSDGPGRLAPVEDAIVEAVRFIGFSAEEIIVDDGLAAADMARARLGAPVRHQQDAQGLFEVYGAQDALEAALSRGIALPGGGRLVIDEAQALTAIDVDTGGLPASSVTRLREKIAVAAAREAARQISLRSIGGQVVIDFPSISNAAARSRFEKVLRESFRTLEGVGAVSFSKSGLFTCTLPHRALSLLDRFTERDKTAPVAGRRFTAEYCAREALRRLEDVLRRSPAAQFRLAAGRAVIACLEEHAQWIARLKDRYGARFVIAPDKNLEERVCDVSETR